MILGWLQCKIFTLMYGICDQVDDEVFSNLRARHALRTRQYTAAAQQYHRASKSSSLALPDAQASLNLAKLAMLAAQPNSLSDPQVTSFFLSFPQHWCVALPYWFEGLSASCSPGKWTCSFWWTLSHVAPLLHVQNCCKTISR